MLNQNTRPSPNRLLVTHLDREYEPRFRALLDELGGYDVPESIVIELECLVPAWTRAVAERVANPPDAWSGGPLWPVGRPTTDVEKSVSDKDHCPLTARQCATAALIAQGYSNKEIARELVVSEGTAANHVRNILQRLGCANRAQVAAWVARPGQFCRTVH